MIRWGFSLCVMSSVVGSIAGAGGISAASSRTLSAAHDPLAYGPDKVRSGVMTAAPHGMVVSAQHLASEAGARVLKQGGNAVDAAVATGYALAVVYPAAGNLGGGGFMTLRPAHGKTVFIDFRERAPEHASATMYLDASGSVVKGQSTQGWKAVAIPGTVAGLEGVRQRWGRLSRAQDMAPAISLARSGFMLEEGDVELLNTSTEYFRKSPEARSIFLRQDGSPLQVGDRLVQKNLAHTLDQLAQGGEDAFYAGPIGEAIVRASQAGGGVLDKTDLLTYRIHLMQPLQCSYRGYTIETAPPPSGGGVALCEMLTILSGDDLGRLGLHTAPALHRMIEAMRHAYSDRRDLGDPAFVSNPVKHMLDPVYAQHIREHIPPYQALASSSLQVGKAQPRLKQRSQSASERERHETTHFSVVDRDGMAVSTTYTLDGWFGAGVMAGNTGIWMNDEMDDFAIKPGEPNMFGIVGSKANAIAPGKTPLSSMAPSIVTKNGNVSMVLGSPGGSRIPTIILSALTGMVDYGLDLRQAVDLPRFHEQWMPEGVEVEEGAISESVRHTLEQQGYRFISHRPWGIAEDIVVGAPRLKGQYTGYKYGVTDPRHPGGGAVGQ